MPKKPTPSKKQAVSSTRSRHAKWAQKKRTKINNQVRLINCDTCGEKKQIHFVCPSCGNYKDRQVIEIDKKNKTLQEVEA